MKERTKRILALAGLIVATAAPAFAGESRYKINVQMHFAQGWDIELMGPAKEMGVEGFRDGVYWSKVETEKGVYDFSVYEPYLEESRRVGLDPMMVFVTSNPLYDDGQTPYTDEGRQAFARFIAATIEAFPDRARRIELGNEFNASNFISGPFEEDRERYFALLAAEVAKAVRAVSPGTEILCTGAHSVPIGYFRKLFESGALESCDAISFHPYRDLPEYVDHEIDRLKALMREFGHELPLYVTEFGKWFDDPAEAPDFMTKMVSLLGASGVREVYWYAFVDQEKWPNMGLLTAEGEDMPAASSYRFLQSTLLPLGTPERIAASNLDHLYRFGPEGRAVVAWGAPGELVVRGEGLRYFDSWGRETAPVKVLGDAPVIVTGEKLSVEVRRDRNYFDSLYQFDDEHWSYFVRRGERDTKELGYMDWIWTSYLGHPHLKPIQVRVDTIIAASFDGVPHYTTERLTAPVDGVYTIDAEWLNAKDDTDGAVIRVEHDGALLAQGTVVGLTPFRLSGLQVELRAGDHLDFAVGPNAELRNQVLDRRIRVTGPQPIN